MLIQGQAGGLLRFGYNVPDDTESMKTRRMNHCHHCDHAAKARCSSPQSGDRVHLLINAACAARAGTAQMTLNDWREVELAVKERLQNGRASMQR